MSATDDLLKNAEAFADGFDKGDLPHAAGTQGRDRGLHGRARSARTRCSASRWGTPT